MTDSLWNLAGHDKNYEGYRTDVRYSDLREWADRAYYRLKLSRYLDPNFPEVFRDNHFYARLWELELVEWLYLTGLELVPTKGGGPDFCVLADGKRIWIEAKVVLPDDEMDSEFYRRARKVTPKAYNIPVKEHVLRYSSSLAYKYGKIERYAEQGIIKPEDYVLIALSAFPPNSMHSDFDFFVQAVLPVGSPVVHFSRDGTPLQDDLPTHAQLEQYENKNGAPVEKDVLMPGDRFPLLDGVIFSEASNLQVLLGSSSSRFSRETNTPHLIPNFATYAGKSLPARFTDFFYLHEWASNPPHYQLVSRDPIRSVQ